MYTTNFESADLMRLPGRDVRVFIGTDRSCCPVKSDHITMGLTSVPARSNMTPHVHDDAEELIFVIEGEGEVVIGGVREPLKPFTAAKFPVGVEHQVCNTGDCEMRFVFMFNPPFGFGK